MAITPVMCCGGECGVSGSTTHITLAGNSAFVTSTPRSGARAVRVNVVATVGAVGFQYNLPSTTDKFTYRLYIRFDTLPSVSSLVTDVFVAGANIPGAYYNASDGKIYAGTGTGALGATGVAITTGSYLRYDVRVNISANPWLVDVQVEGVACGQKSLGVAAATSSIIECTMGAGGSSFTVDAYYDDFVLSNTVADYPIGPGYVNHFVPTSDGTHNVISANDFERTITGTDIDNSTTDAYQLIDDVPLESGASPVDWINMVAPVNYTDYVECVFGPAPGISAPTAVPRAVEFIIGYHQAGSGLGNIAVGCGLTGSLATIFIYEAVQVAGVTSVAYARKHVVNEATHLKNGTCAVQLLSGSFGGTVDANPDQYLDCAMIEAEFAEVVTAVNESANPGQIGPVYGALV